MPDESTLGRLTVNRGAPLHHSECAPPPTGTSSGFIYFGFRDHTAWWCAQTPFFTLGALPATAPGHPCATFSLTPFRHRPALPSAGRPL